MYPTSNASVEVATQTPAVSVELQRLEKVHMELTEIAAALDSRLAVVMREPEPATPKVTENRKEPYASSQLVSALRCRVNDAEGVMYRLSEILRRLEI
jgi:hypothetical protein